MIAGYQTTGARESRNMANLLIVDDDLEMADASRQLLESVGHRIRVGHNGEEGLASLSTAPLPECLLLDLDMPVLDGQGMARQMRLRDGGQENIPIVLVSGRSDLPAVAARMGTPYFVKKACADYGAALLEMLARALLERRPPTSA
jgi:FixJ family two-component response regulator